MPWGREERTLQAEDDLGLRCKRPKSWVQGDGGVGELLEEARPAGEELGGGCQVSRFLELKSQISGFCSKMLICRAQGHPELAALVEDERQRREMELLHPDEV